MNRICEVFLWICRKNYFTSFILHIEKCLVLFNTHIPKFKPETQQLALKWAAVLKDKHQCGPVSTGWSEMRPQLQKTLLVPLSSSGRSDFNIQLGETRSSCSQEEALRPAWVKEAVGGGSEGGGGVGGGGAGVLLRSSPLYSVFITAGSWRESEPGGVSHQRRVLKEGRRLHRSRGTFSFLASARDPHSSSPAPRSVGEHRERLKEQFTRNQSSII